MSENDDYLQVVLELRLRHTLVPGLLYEDH